MAQYPVKAGFYDKNELSRLCSTLGYPGSFLLDGLKAASSQQLQAALLKLSQNKRVSNRVVHALLKCKHMQTKLEKVFNRYPADFNKKLFAKAMSLLKYRRLSFSEISDARVAYDLYASEDGGGMLPSADTVLQALKMLERVMSPVRLESEIQKQQKVVDLPSSIQVYEFMDLVIKCALSSEVEREMELVENPELHDLNHMSSLTDFDQLLMTKDKKIQAFLDKQYRDSLFILKREKEEAESNASSSISVHRLASSQREESVASALQQRRALTPSLEFSQHQLFRARGGFTVLTGEQCREIESLRASRQSSRAGMRPSTSCSGCTQSSPRQWTRSGLDSCRVTHTPAPARRPETQDHPMHSKSAPLLLPSIQRHADRATRGEEMVVEDLGDEISEICIESVYNASNALRESMSRLPHFSRPVVEGGGITKSGPSRRIRYKTKVVMVRPRAQSQPIITKEDMERHQGIIDDIEWKQLHRKWRYPTNPTTPLPSQMH